MRLTESKDVEAPVVLYANDRGILTTKMNLKGNRGFPDHVFWVPGGKPLVMEFKLPGEEPDPLQAFTILRLRRAGYDVHVVDTKEEGIRLIDSRLKRVARAT